MSTERDSDTRERILIEASRLFAARGYFGTSTRAIAEAVGIQQPSLFHHFPTKQAIMTELLELDLDAALAMTKREATGPGRAVVKLLRYLVEDTYALLSSPYDLVVNNHAAVLEAPEFARYGAMREELCARSESNVVRIDFGKPRQGCKPDRTIDIV